MAGPRTNLVEPLSGFVGRAIELERVRARLHAGHRLVTLGGPPGIGKTRLALEAARACCEDDALDGVWFCDLTEARDADDLCAAVARALDVSLASTRGGPTVARLGALLAAQGEVLLVLDNFEQLVPCAEDTVGVLLRASPTLRVLVTSRERLRLAGEVCYAVPPLGLPEHDRDLRASDAVRLFRERVRALVPDFELDAEAAPAVVQIVRRLEGNPLCIQLAAAQVEMLGLAGVLERLPNPLDLLVDGARDADARQHTLRAAIQWSWGLLEPCDQAALADCSPFRGGFTLAAADAVLEKSDGGRTILDRLSALRDKSLVATYDPSPRAQRRRFRLPESVRAYAYERLVASGRAAETEARHTRYYLDLAERGDALRDLAEDLENVLAAAERRLAEDTAEAGVEALRALVTMEPAFVARGHIDRYVDLLDRASTARGVDPLLRARVLQARGRACQVGGRHGESLRDLEAAIAAASALGEETLAATALTDLGVLHHQRRDTEAARRCYEDALALHTRTGERRQAARVRGNLAALWHDLGQYARARAGYEEALVAYRELGDRRLEGIFSTNLGVLAQEQHELVAAATHFERAAALLESVGDRRLLAITHTNQGMLLHEQGDAEGALPFHLRARAALAALGDRRSEGLCLGRIAGVCASLGRLQDALSRLEAAERVIAPLGDPVSMEAVRAQRGFVELALGERAHGAGAIKEAEHHLAQARDYIERAAPMADRSDDVRATVRMLRGGCDALEVRVSARRSELVVGPDCRWFRPPGGPCRDIHRRGALRLILGALVERREAHPGEPLPMDALFAEGWPGASIAPEAAANRVYVALATLRKLGLRELVFSEPGGYLLDPRMTVRRDDSTQPEGGVATEPTGSRRPDESLA